MPYFNDSMALHHENPSPTRICHSFMCPSKLEYFSDKRVGTQNYIDKSTQMCSQTRITQEKLLQQNISKLRSILSETISNLTRDNNLKKGESVELTLEIELMNSVENTPSNSLVEVTIIQHINKHDSKNKLNKLPNKMIFKIENDKPSMGDSLSRRQQNCLKPAISRENATNREMRVKDGDSHEHSNHKKYIHKPLSCSKTNQQLQTLNKIDNLEARRDFINVLPEETTNTETVLKGSQKVSQRKTRQEPIDVTSTTQALPKNLTKKRSLMNKISGIFMPPKKPSGNEVVKNALTALKNEIDKMQTKMEKENRPSRKRDSVQIQDLGKLINNILFDVMSSMTDDSKNEVKEEPSLPIQYQSFFEPVTKTKKKLREKKLPKRKISPSINKLYRSHSDTCCMKQELQPRLKTSNSISDCKSHVAESEGNTKQSHKKRRKESNTRDYSRGRKKNLKDYRDNLQNVMAKGDTNTLFLPQRTPFSKSTLVHWKGRYVKVSKDIKARIEMLILNELDNLALKEGMEYNVMPLSSMDETSKDSTTVEKISSFICELDISDKNVKKIIKKKKSHHKKVSTNQYPTKILKMESNSLTHKVGTCYTTMCSGTQTAPYISTKNKSIHTNNSKPSNNQTIKNNVNTLHKANNNRNSTLVNFSDVEHNSVEIKYMNDNVVNWSSESQTLPSDSPEKKISSKKTMAYENIDRDSTSSKNSKFISTGFVKLINSNDSSWNNHSAGRWDQIPSQDLTETSTNITGQTSDVTEKSISKTSNEYNSSIEIELDIEDLEYILQEAKHNYGADKVLIEAKCIGSIKRPNSLKYTRKNSPSYTNQLLANAAKKLEKYAKTKSGKKKSKHRSKD